MLERSNMSIFGSDGKVLRPTEDNALGLSKRVASSRHAMPGTAARLGQLVSLRCDGEHLVAVVRKDNGKLTTKVVKWVKGCLVAQ